MKYIFLFLFLIPLYSFGQANCNAAYFHRNRLLDSLPVPVNIRNSVDSFKKVSDAALALKAKTLKDSIHDQKKAKKIMKKLKKQANGEIIKAKRKWLSKYYAEKIKNAQMEIYDKGKKYKYVFDADSGSYKVTPECCDETVRMYKLVIEAK